VGHSLVFFSQSAVRLYESMVYVVKVLKQFWKETECVWKRFRKEAMCFCFRQKCNSNN